jgi:hypothetical protein
VASALSITAWAAVIAFSKAVLAAELTHFLFVGTSDPSPAALTSGPSRALSAALTAVVKVALTEVPGNWVAMNVAVAVWKAYYTRTAGECQGAG